MINAAYSTFNTLFTVNAPFSTVQVLSTLEGSNFSTIDNYISSIYPSIYAGPGLSSLSSYVNPNFSSLSTSLNIVFSSFSNSINNISSLRTDPGICSLSTFVTIEFSNYNSSFTVLNQSTLDAVTSSAAENTKYNSFSNYYTIQIPVLSVQSSIQQLTLTTVALSNFINTNIGVLTANTSNVSSTVQIYTLDLLSSFNSLQGPFTSTAYNLLSSYTTLSSIVQRNVFSPTFSTFTTNAITTSNLTVSSRLFVSSIGIQTSTSVDYNFAMLGSARILQPSPPTISRIMVGTAYDNATSYMNSNVIPYI
jgi:hypothetical protein